MKKFANMPTPEVGSTDNIDKSIASINHTVEEEGDDSFNSEHSYSAKLCESQESCINEELVKDLEDTAIPSGDDIQPSSLILPNTDTINTNLTTSLSALTEPAASLVFSPEHTPWSPKLSGYISPVTLDEVVPVSMSPFSGDEIRTPPLQASDISSHMPMVSQTPTCWFYQ